MLGLPFASGNVAPGAYKIGMPSLMCLSAVLFYFCLCCPIYLYFVFIWVHVHGSRVCVHYISHFTFLFVFTHCALPHHSLPHHHSYLITISLILVMGFSILVWFMSIAVFASYTLLIILWKNVCLFLPYDCGYSGFSNIFTHIGFPHITSLTLLVCCRLVHFLTYVYTYLPFVSILELVVLLLAQMRSTSGAHLTNLWCVPVVERVTGTSGSGVCRCSSHYTRILLGSARILNLERAGRISASGALQPWNAWPASPALNLERAGRTSAFGALQLWNAWPVLQALFTYDLSSLSGLIGVWNCFHGQHSGIFTLIALFGHSREGYLC